MQRCLVAATMTACGTTFTSCKRLQTSLLKAYQVSTPVKAFKIRASKELHRSSGAFPQLHTKLYSLQVAGQPEYLMRAIAAPSSCTCSVTCAVDHVKPKKFTEKASSIKALPCQLHAFSSAHLLEQQQMLMTASNAAEKVMALTRHRPDCCRTNANCSSTSCVHTARLSGR